MNLEAVIFDLDGTLIDSMGVWIEVDKEYLGKRGIETPDNLFDDIESGNSFIEVAEYFKNKFDLPDSLETIMNEWTEMVRWHYENEIPLKKGVLEFLEFLQSSEIKMGIGTSNSDQLARIVLKANRVDDKFGTVTAGCREIKGKPFPDIFLRVASDLGVKPENCLVIEDVYVGVLAAKAAGMTVFAIQDEHAKYEWDKIQDEADFSASNFSAIHKQLKKILR
ncbi:MAG: HAD family phosphatase [Candidatus Cloacimonadota bacterium]|nr:HAD family phosphatase [Candidatus Cloacimonadota bacterium]